VIVVAHGGVRGDDAAASCLRRKESGRLCALVQTSSRFDGVTLEGLGSSSLMLETG
jgi:hypothetical protein